MTRLRNDKNKFKKERSFNTMERITLLSIKAKALEASYILAVLSARIEEATNNSDIAKIGECAIELQNIHDALTMRLWGYVPQNTESEGGEAEW